MFRYVQKDIPHFEHAQVDKKYYTALISSAQIKNIKFLASYNMVKKKLLYDAVSFGNLIRQII